MILEPALPQSEIAEFERRARAILVADVVAYTRLMEAAEIETHRRLRNLRVGIIDPAVISFRGEVVKNTGDGFVAVFESPIDALRCAAELQRDISANESGQAPERQLMFRIGIHWEPVIFDIKDVYGAGVNLAARLQTAAAAGGIVVTSTLLEQSGDLQGFSLEDLGELQFKNLSRSVHAFAMVLPGVGPSTARSVALQRSGSARLPSVAVLPFTYLLSEPDDRFLAEGFAEDIISTLSNVPELLVVSRGSTFSFGQQGGDAETASEKLGVRYLLSGSVRRKGDRIRTSVEFVDVAKKSVIWAERFDAPVGEIFSLQDEIAIKIVAKMASSVRSKEMIRALRVPPQNLNAYDYLLRALDLLYRLDFASFSRAKTLLERAREEDPGYAAAYAFSALWHIFNFGEGWSNDPDADAAELIRLSNCAIERDPSNALALALQGHGRGMFHRDYDAAIELFDRALSASPSNAWAWVLSSGTYGFIGQADSGVARAERAIRLSPLDQQAFFNFGLLGQNHYLNGSFQDAARWSRKSLNLNPRFGNAARVLAASLVGVGRVRDAREIASHHGRLLSRFRVSDYARRCPFKQPQADLYCERLQIAGIPA